MRRTVSCRTVSCCLLCVVLVCVAFQARALSPGKDILVPAAVRAGTWVTDLYVLNHSEQSTSVTAFWLVRDQANTSPESRTFTLGPGEALVLDDVILGTFGLSEGAGAFRVVSEKAVIVSSRIYNQQSGVTFGQGFEGMPRGMAVSAGGSTDIVGLANSASFRTNLAAIDASGNGASVSFTLYDETGAELSSRTWAFDEFEPRLKSITSVFSGLATFDYATLHAEVTRGSAFIVASKVDNDPSTGDPSTLESWTTSAADPDGTYEIALYDSYGYSTGGFLEVENGQVTFLKASYSNYDKGSDPESPDCDLVFLFGGQGADVHPLQDYAQGVSYSQSFPESGTMTFTVSFEVSDNMTLTGTVDAVGSDFSYTGDSCGGDETGCNGTFPSLTLRGGKSPTVTAKSAGWAAGPPSYR